jgi:F5/8 type C domain/Putative binding domain, N-terminal
MLLMQVAIGQIQFNYDATGNRVKRFATNAPTYSLSISSQTGLTSVVAAGGSNVGNFVVASTNVSWSITGVPSWATVNSSSGGNGNSTINVSFTANSTTSARSATLTISGNNGVSNQTVSISQVGSSGGGCIVNKVRLAFRTDCCADRILGAKIQGSNNGSSWTDIYTFNQNAAGGWEDFTFSNTVAYTSVRFQAGPNGYGELSGLEFYSGTTKLSGTPIGSTGAYANDPKSSGISFMNGTGYGFWHGDITGASNYAGLQLSGCTIGCTSPPSAPILSANPASGVPTTLTASGCSGGTITWNDNSTGTTKNVSSAGTYTATCTTSGCPVSAAGSITIGSNLPPCPSISWVVNADAVATCNGQVTFKIRVSGLGVGQTAQFSIDGGINFVNSNLDNGSGFLYIRSATGDCVSFNARVTGCTDASKTIWGCLGGNSNPCSGRVSAIDDVSKSNYELFESDDFGTNPNPSSGKVMVSFIGESGTFGTLIVHDMLGQTLLTDSIEANLAKLVELPNHFVGVS